MRIAVLAGGVGGARFLLGVRAWARRAAPDALGSDAEITAIVNTGDDMWLTGLRITPDLDSIMYALAGVNDTERGWGRVGESDRVAAELRAWDAGWPWFTLGDLDLGAHIARTGWLREGVPLSAVVARLTARWPLGVRLLPATDDEAETHVMTASGTLHFQEWWTRHRAAIPALGFEQRGVSSAAPAPGVTAALAEADVVLVAPSNPVVSIGTILGIPGIRSALATTAAPVVGVSGIIGGAVVRGMADACLSAIGVETAADAVARWYGARNSGGVLDAWLMAEEDAALVPAVESAGIRSAAAPLWLRGDDTSADVVAAALALAGIR
ncbi:MAG: 2-phospho-L-lactate transferase [Micrococcales bacterium]|nr:2-phospho-L-lactate transferase [Micrococcales bacterium]